MNIKELKKYIADLPDNMKVICNDNEITSYGITIQSKLHKKLGDYLSISTEWSEKEVLEIRRKERWLKYMISKGHSRDEAKEIYMRKKIYPFMPKHFSLTAKNVFNYENDLHSLLKS